MKTKTNFYVTLAALLITLFSMASHAHDVATKAPEKKPEMVVGEVRKINKDANKITLKHGEIKSLDMSAMTMVFLLKDAKLIDGIKVGDMVKFSVEQTKNSYVVTSIEVAKIEAAK